MNNIGICATACAGAESQLEQENGAVRRGSRLLFLQAMSVKGANAI